MILPTFLPLTENIGIEIQRAEGRYKFRTYLFVVIALVNCTSTIFVCKKFGEIGAAACTAVTLFIGEWIIMNFYYNKYCSINVSIFLMNLLRMSIAFIPSIILGIFIDKFILVNNWFVLIALILVFTLLYLISMYYIGLNNTEKTWVNNEIKKIVRKKDG